MIIDFQNDAEAAAKFNVIDAVTGENIDHRHIFYADDEAGIYRHYHEDGKGSIVMGARQPDGSWEILSPPYWAKSAVVDGVVVEAPDSPQEVWTEVRAPILIVPKEGVTP